MSLFFRKLPASPKCWRGRRLDRRRPADDHVGRSTRRPQRPPLTTSIGDPTHGRRLMTDQGEQPPRLAQAGRHRGEERQDRQAKALRDNLLKRKAQQRARTASGQAGNVDELCAGPAPVPDS
jgi:hypothetical protein